MWYTFALKYRFVASNCHVYFRLYLKTTANGLYHRNEHVQITASLGGITLESEALMPGQTTVFDINLVWETDKKVIKRYVYSFYLW